MKKEAIFYLRAVLNWSLAFRRKLKKKDKELYLALCWEYLNVLHFQGQMKSRPDFEVVSEGPFRGAYKADIVKGRVKSSAIIIHEKSFNLSIIWFKDVLLHEMAHQYCFEVLKKPHRRHTKLWKKVCKKAGCRTCD